MISKKRFMNLMAKYEKHDYRVSLRIDMEPERLVDCGKFLKQEIIEQLPKGFEMFDVPVNIGVTFVTAKPELPKWWTENMIAAPDFTEPADYQYWRLFGGYLVGAVVKNVSRFCITTIRKKYTLDENLYGKPGVYCNVFVDDYAVAVYRRMKEEL